MGDTRWPAGHPREAEIRAELARLAEPVPCASTITRGDLERLDNIVSFMEAIGRFTDPSLYDDAWNVRNHLVPFAPGDKHYDEDCNNG
jgi:hypothetical protein